MAVDVAVVLLAGGEPGEPGEALGGDRAAAVQRLMVDRARAWAVAGFGEAAVRTLAVDDLAVGEVLRTADPDRPLLAVVPALAMWRPELVTDVLEDLRCGCAMSVGPVFDGGFYLLAVAEPGSELVRSFGAREARDRDAMIALVAGAEREGAELGLLRTERGLRRDADVRATLADPLCDPELRGLLASRP